MAFKILKGISSRNLLNLCIIPNKIACRLITGENGVSLKTLKLKKRLFSTILFGGTFVTAVLLNRRKKRQIQEIFEGCEMLKPDKNFAKARTFYRYKGFVLPDFIIKNKAEIEAFEVDPMDIFVVSFPKTGTTWVQEIIYLIESNLNFEEAKSVGLETRFPYLEYVYPGIKSVSRMPTPRLIKSHLPISLLPPDIETKKPKIICVMRNPKDVVVSFYHFLQTLTITDYQGTFEEFADSFLKDDIMYGPLWKHYGEFWERKNDENVLIVKYEDLKKDIIKEINRIARFLGKELSEDDAIRIRDHCSFSEMSQNPSVNYSYWDDIGLRKKEAVPFMRKGVIGDWKNYFSEKDNARMDTWIQEKFEPLGLNFDYEERT